jgi:hypothetical protein
METVEVLVVTFGQQTVGKTTFWVVFEVQKLCVENAKCLGRQLTSKTRKCGSSEGLCSWKHKNHYLWSCKHVGSFVWVSLDCNLIVFWFGSIYAMPAVGGVGKELCLYIWGPYKRVLKEMQSTVWLVSFPRTQDAIKRREI